MSSDDLSARVAALEEQIARLPKGNISMKTIKGKPQPYLQWTQNGKRISQYVRQEGRARVLAKIEERKRLERELAALKEELSASAAPLPASAEAWPPVVPPSARPLFELSPYHTRVQTGSALSLLCGAVSRYQRRNCFAALEKYLQSEDPGRVCLLYGLRRTGKTTLLLQAIAGLPAEKTAYIKILPTDSFAALDGDLQALAARGYRYIFIDEVTLLPDFIDISSVFSDIYAMMGIKIVLSGTDSLGFLLSSREELYDRARVIHTTFIPFREYARLLGLRDIDEYIRFGGTLRMGEADFDDPELRDESISFRDDESTRRYIDTAIAWNIQHSLAHYRQGSRFRHLIDLYDAGELTNAVNRIIEDMNHSFLLSVLTREFISNDLGLSRKNLRKNPDPARRSDALYHIDTRAVTDRLRRILDIRNPGETKTAVTADHVTEIQEYLYLLDLIIDCPIETIQGEKPIPHVLFTQPGMRYSQAQALVHFLMQDPFFSALDWEERSTVTERILEEVRGRMMEDILLLESTRALGRKGRAFKLQFPAGEFDMVTIREGERGCRIFEIKHSNKIFPAQYRFLLDEEMCARTEHRFGPILEKTVLYRGKSTCLEKEGIRYLNVEEYLLR